MSADWQIKQTTTDDGLVVLYPVRLGKNVLNFEERSEQDVVVVPDPSSPGPELYLRWFLFRCSVGTEPAVRSGCIVERPHRQALRRFRQP